MNDRDWGLCVGIGSYGDGSRLNALPGALNDADAIYKWLTDPEGGAVPEKQCDLILSPAAQAGPPLPTADRIEGFLRKRYQDAGRSEAAGKGFKAGRRLWLYYSGHGVGFSAEEDAGLLTADTMLPFDLPHIPGLAWASLFQASAAFDEVVLFMDCCRTAGHTPLRRPSVLQVHSEPQGKMVAAFAVSDSRAALEKIIDGVPRGEFTHALETLLKLPRQTAVSAREFLLELERDYPALDPRPPRSLASDFVLLPVSPAATRRAAPAVPPDSLIVHGETTGGLAASLAQKMNGPERATDYQWFGQVLHSPPSAYEHVRNLIVVRDIEGDELRKMVDALVKVVKPEKTVIYGETDPGLDIPPNTHFVLRGAAADVDFDEAAIKVDAALAEAHGSLLIVSGEGLAKLQLWDSSGRAVDQAFGRMEHAELPVGSYRVHASLGSLHGVFEVKVATGKRAKLRVDLVKGFTLESTPLEPAGPSPGQDKGSPGPPEAAVKSPGQDKSHCAISICGTQARISVPAAGRWRAERCVVRIGEREIESLRIVPPGHPLGGAHPADGIRTCLRLVMSAPFWPAEPPPAGELHGDPVCLLLAAALLLRNGKDPGAHLAAACALLGCFDPDIQLLAGPAMLSEPPLLSFGWFFRLRRGELSVVKDSAADSLVGNLLASDPWLAWTEDPSKGGSWLRQVANAAWPGWDVEPDLGMSAGHIEEVAPMLGAPIGSVRRRTYKSPPIDRLARHEQVAFVGASNDQLPAALAVAFVERGHRKWKRLEIWSLTDQPLSEMQSAGRSGAALVAARDEAEKTLRKLLEMVAEEWTMQRYQEMLLDGAAHFASLWDWKQKGGFVHSSKANPKKDVRTISFDDQEWLNDEPPDLYRKVVEAYDALEPISID